MVIMSVDYGDVRTGIAVCDKNEILASPVCVITERNADRLADKISELIQQYKVQQVAIGLPKNMDGSEGFRADACKDFAALLHQKINVDIVMRDERLTTVSAHKYMDMTDTRGKKRKQSVDAVAAVIILEDYLSYRKNMI